jgi:DNA-binding transcriptional LysR family regulator
MPLCLLTPEMQNRRIVDGVFRSVGCEPRAAVETNSIINLCSHVSSGLWSSVLPYALLSLLGLPEGTKALRLTTPVVKHTIGLLIADREPPLPLARALFLQTPGLGLEAAIRQKLPIRAE